MQSGTARVRAHRPLQCLEILQCREGHPKQRIASAQKFRLIHMPAAILVAHLCHCRAHLLATHHAMSAISRCVESLWNAKHARVLMCNHAQATTRRRT